jgi:putative membrane protein
MKAFGTAGMPAAVFGLLLACNRQTPAENAAQPSSPPAGVATAETTPALPSPTAEAAPAPAPADTAAPSAAPPAAASADALTDEQIAAITSLANNSEIEQAKLARARSKDEQVLQFAGMMIAHHGEAQRKQDAMSLGSADSTLSRDMIVEGSETMRTLKEKTGTEFDRAYMQAQIQGHQKVLDAIEKHLLPNAKREDLKAYLTELRPRVKQHLEQAERAAAALSARQLPSVASQ